MIFPVSILMTALGIAMIWKPAFFYEMLESWKHDGRSEPSKFYLWNTRLGGVMLVLVGIGCMIILTFIPQT